MYTGEIVKWAYVPLVTTVTLWKRLRFQKTDSFNLPILVIRFIS